MSDKLLYTEMFCNRFYYSPVLGLQFNYQTFWMETKTKTTRLRDLVSGKPHVRKITADQAGNDAYVIEAILPDTRNFFERLFNLAKKNRVFIHYEGAHGKEEVKYMTRAGKMGACVFTRANGTTFIKETGKENLRLVSLNSWI